MSVPLGTILPFYGTEQQLPKNYLFCNGGVITKTSFPDLYGHLVLANQSLKIDDESCHLPDLRGEFIRGADFGRNVDLVLDPMTGKLVPRKFGTWEEDALQKHSHRDRGHTHSTDATAATAEDKSDNSDERALKVKPPQAQISIGYASITDPTNSSDESAGPVRVAYETRPRNIAINFIIKTTRTAEDPTSASIRRRLVLRALEDVPEPERSELIESYDRSHPIEAEDE